MAREIIRGYDVVKGQNYTYEKRDGSYTDNEGHGKTQEEADKDFKETTNLKNETE